MITTTNRQICFRPETEDFKPDKVFANSNDGYSCKAYFLGPIVDSDPENGSPTHSSYYPNGFNNIQIITHTDLDGYASAALVVQFLTKSGTVSPNAIHIEHHDYTDQPSIDKDAAMIFITDYSLTKQNETFSDEIIDAMRRNVPVFWFDHHASSMSYLESLSDKNDKYQILSTLPGIRDVNFCATALVWKFYNPCSQFPKAVLLIDDFDCCKLKYPESRYLNYAFYSTKHIMDTDPKSNDWVYLINGYSNPWYRMNDLEHQLPQSASEQLLTKMLDYGDKYEEIITDYNNITVARSAFVARIRGFEDSEAIFLGTTDYGSMIFGKYLKSAENPNGRYERAIAMRMLGDVLECSVYSSDDASPNAKEIAEKFGGGGHPGASGFTIKIDKETESFEVPYVLNTIQKLDGTKY